MPVFRFLPRLLLVLTAWSLSTIALAQPAQASPVSLAADSVCAFAARGIPARPAQARGGSAFADSLAGLTEPERDRAIRDELLSGNLSPALRRVSPATVTGPGPGGLPDRQVGASAAHVVEAAQVESGDQPVAFGVGAQVVPAVAGQHSVEQPQLGGCRLGDRRIGAGGQHQAPAVAVLLAQLRQQVGLPGQARAIGRPGANTNARPGSPALDIAGCRFGLPRALRGVSAAHQFLALYALPTRQRVVARQDRLTPRTGAVIRSADTDPC